MVTMLEENKQGFCKRYPNRWLGLSHMIFFVVVLQSGRFLSVATTHKMIIKILSRDQRTRY